MDSFGAKVTPHVRSVEPNVTGCHSQGSGGRWFPRPLGSRCAGSRSDIALHEHADRDGAYPPHAHRLAHTGFGVSRTEDLVAAYDFFQSRSRVLLAADFGVSWSVMGTDPDGNVVEIELFHEGATSTQPGFAPLDVETLRRSLS